MSHVVKAKVEIKNEACLVRAAEFLGLTNLGRDTHKLYNGQKAEGLAFTLPAWDYPVVINTDSGEVSYDNYGEHWGKQIELDKLVQRYSVETLNDQAAIEGYTVGEEELDNGDIELSMHAFA